MYYAADEAPLVSNVKFAAVQMDASCFRGVYGVKLHVEMLASDATQHGGRVSIREAFAKVLLPNQTPTHHVPSIYCQIAKKTH